MTKFAEFCVVFACSLFVGHSCGETIGELTEIDGRKNKPCEEYATRLATSAPARCFENFKGAK